MAISGNKPTTSQVGIQFADAPLYITGMTVYATEAGAAQDGYLTQVDWNTFNNKSDYVSPLTTIGDLVYYNAGDQRLPIGPDGYYLTIESGLPVWGELIVPPSGVTSVTADAPLASSGGATPNITITKAATAQDGYLSSTDWNTFNGKLADPMTTRGDLVYRDSSNLTDRLPIGADGYVLTSDGYDVSWAPATGIAGANIYLSNLDATTAVNTSLLPATTDSIDLGSPTKQWEDGYFSSIIQPKTDKVLIIQGSRVDTTKSRAIDIMTLESTGGGHGGDITIYTGENSTANKATGSVSMSSGAASDGYSGNVNSITGMAKFSGHLAVASGDATETSGSITIYTGGVGTPGGTSGDVLILTGPSDGQGGDVFIGTQTASIIGKLYFGTNSTDRLVIDENGISIGDYTGGSTNYVLPLTRGTNGQILQTDGSGNVTWQTAAGGGVTSVTADAPLASSGGATPNLTITLADSVTDGYLSSTDWNNFDGKVTDPMTTRGDIIIRDATNTTARLGIGTSGYVLTSDGTDIAWAAASGGGANTALSNLAAVAINTSLVSDTNNTDDLGSASVGWKDIYSYTNKLKGSTSGTLTIQTAATTTDYTVTMPSTQAAAASVTMNDGAGALSWKQVTPVTLTDAATIATDASLSNVFKVTLGGNRTLGAPTNPTDGQRVVWRITQDATGTRTLAYDAVFRFGTDITAAVLTTTANKTDYLGAIYNAAAVKWDIVAFVKGY